MRSILIFLLLAVFTVAAFTFVTAPEHLNEHDRLALAGAAADQETGELVFWAAGCASCHVPEGAEKSNAPLLSGGQKFVTDFGTFYAPNISPDPAEGIGIWSLDEFANALLHGVSPSGQHYFPAFPYTAYAKMTHDDIAALYTFMRTLPASEVASKPHEVAFPFSIRRNLGGWKFLFRDIGWVLDGELTEAEKRGRYLSEAMAHCGECHTPRNSLGGAIKSRWLAGAPNPNGQGTIPNITPAKLDWSDIDLVTYLTQGFTPDFDTVGGHMVSVVENLARLPESDVSAIVAYLRKIPSTK